MLSIAPASNGYILIRKLQPLYERIYVVWIMMCLRPRQELWWACFWLCCAQEIAVWVVSLQIQHDQAGGAGEPLWWVEYCGDHWRGNLRQSLQSHKQEEWKSSSCESSGSNKRKSLIDWIRRWKKHIMVLMFDIMLLNISVYFKYKNKSLNIWMETSYYKCTDNPN